MVAEYPKEGEVRERNLFQKTQDKFNRTFPLIPESSNLRRITEFPSNVARDYIWDPGDKRPGKDTYIDKWKRRVGPLFKKRGEGPPQVDEFSGIEKIDPEYTRQIYDPESWKGFRGDLKNWAKYGLGEGADWLLDVPESVFSIGGLDVDIPFTKKRFGAGEHGDWMFEPGNIEGFGKAGSSIMFPLISKVVGESVDPLEYLGKTLDLKMTGIEPVVMSWVQAKGDIDYKRSIGEAATKEDYSKLQAAQKQLDDLGISSPSGFASQAGRDVDMTSHDFWADYQKSLEDKFFKESTKDYLTQFWGDKATLTDRGENALRNLKKFTVDGKEVYGYGEGDVRFDPGDMIEGKDWGAFNRFSESRFFDEIPERDEKYKSRIGKTILGDPVVDFIPELAAMGGVLKLATKAVQKLGPTAASGIRNIPGAATIFKPGLFKPALQDLGYVVGGGGIATIADAMRDRNVNLYGYE